MHISGRNEGGCTEMKHFTTIIGKWYLAASQRQEKSAAQKKVGHERIINTLRGTSTEFNKIRGDADMLDSITLGIRQT